MIKSILLPIDGSSYTQSVLEYGVFLAQKFKAFLHVFTVVDIRLYEWNLATGADSFVPVIPSTEYQEESQHMLEQKADRILSKASDWLKQKHVKYTVSRTSGIPVDEICQKAQISDLVILGIRGEYERWRNKMLGATVESVTRQINATVLLVDKQFTPFEQIICGYDGSTFAGKALQFAAFTALSLKMPLEVVTVLEADKAQEVLKEAEQYLKAWEIQYKLRQESGEVAEVLVGIQNSAPVPSLTVIGSYGHSRLREAILGSTTVEVMRKAKKPILLAK